MDTKNTPPPDAASKELPEKYIRTFAMDKDALEKGVAPGLTPLEKTAVAPLSEKTVDEPGATALIEGEESFPEPPPVPTFPLSPPSAEVGGALPDEYIRTFENDSTTLKEGGTPDLVPFVKQNPVAPPATPLEQSATVFPEEILPLEPIPEKEPVKTAELPGATPLKTYAEDFRDKLEETHASAATVLAAEQDAVPQYAQSTLENSSQKGHTLWFILTGLVLLLVGGIGVYFAYTQYLVKIAPVVIAPGVATPIFVDSRETISGAGTVLVQAIEKSVQEPLPLNTIRLLSFAPSVTDTDVFSALDLSAPGILLRNIDVPNSMAGVIHTINGQSPFFILTVGSYTTTFSGMLAWEPTLVSNMSALFPLYPTLATATTTATSTATTTQASPPRSGGNFRDEVVSNHDVRIYRDLQGNSVVLYGYWNQSTLVIARDPVAFAEILTRLATSQSH
ncbi:MAG TPA: hypothetical protein VMV38_00130 [Candidatus Paceibacterota bacterium]|nr:hypothetical protein [Candidatus Paceibacterota bacterium]